MNGINCLVIGDIHFKISNIPESHEFIQKTIECAKQKKPNFIVLLGDILDTHEIVRVQVHKLAEELIQELSNIARTYILIGNHDYINNSQFLTDNHIFTPFKKWENVVVCDEVKIDYFKDNEGIERSFIFCPYVPAGKFVKALDTLLNIEESWEFASMIFAHQEFNGCKMNKITSNAGDLWDENYPPVVSGHIHEAQKLGNIYYIGSAIQTSFGDTSPKRLWFIKWDIENENDFLIEKIDLELRKKILLKFTTNEIIEDPDKILKKIKGNIVKIKLTGESDELVKFRKSKIYEELSKNSVRFEYILKQIQIPPEEVLRRVDVEYKNVFKEMVDKKDEHVKQKYLELFS